MERIQGHGNPAHPARQPGHTHTRIPESAPRTKRNPESATTSPANHGSGSDRGEMLLADGHPDKAQAIATEIGGVVAPRVAAGRDGDGHRQTRSDGRLTAKAGSRPASCRAVDRRGLDEPCEASM